MRECARYPTTTTILSDAPDPSEPDEPFTVTVSVSDDPVSCSDVLVAGMASCALTRSAPGTYTLTASYGGDDTFSPSSANETHTVGKRDHYLYLPLVTH